MGDWFGRCHTTALPESAEAEPERMSSVTTDDNYDEVGIANRACEPNPVEHACPKALKAVEQLKQALSKEGVVIPDQ